MTSGSKTSKTTETGKEVRMHPCKIEQEKHWIESHLKNKRMYKKNGQYMAFGKKREFTLDHEDPLGLLPKARKSYNSY